VAAAQAFVAAGPVVAAEIVVELWELVRREADWLSAKWCLLMQAAASRAVDY